MDKKFLNKVVDQIISETRIDYDKKRISFPFSHSSLLNFLSSSRSFLFPLLFFSYTSTSLLSFSDHCKDIYGLNEQEIDYVWREYINGIINKIENS